MYPRLFRKRIIPAECLPLDKDEIVSFENNRLVSKWHAIRPKKDLHHGISCYFFEDGFKVSKFYTEDGTLLYWYCDIISTSYNEESRSYVFTDLLVDILVYEDGSVRVVDLDELAQFIELEKISKKEVVYCLNCASNLLKDIDHGSFAAYQDIINRYDRTQTS